MILHRPLSLGVLVASCLVMALITGDALAQMTPYGVPNAYAVGNYQVPGAYPVYNYPATYGVQQMTRVARMNPEIIGPPPMVGNAGARPGLLAPVAGGTVPYVETYNSQAIPGQTLNGSGCNGCAIGGSGRAVGTSGYAATGATCNAGYGHIGGLFRHYGHRMGHGYGAGCRHWFGGVYGLYMTHDNENERWMSWDGADLSRQLLDARESSPGWQTGNELRFGSTLACHNAAWEVVFWGLYGEQGQQVATTADVTGALNTVFDFSGLDYDNGTGTVGPVNDWYDDAQMHRVMRHFEVQNIEINLIHFPLACCVGPCGATCDSSCGGGSGIAGYGGVYNFGGLYGRGSSAGCGPRFSIVGSAGIRYMRIDEWLDFDTDDTDTTFGSSEDELFYDIETENHLFGFQLGCAMNLQLTDRLSLYADSKGGIYNNHVQHSSLIWGQGGFAYVAAGQPYAGQNFNVQSTKDDVAFLGELRLGMTYRVRCNWQIYTGYRVIGLSGVALPTNQIPQYFADTVGVGLVDSNGSMILHGAQFGVEFAY